MNGPQNLYARCDDLRFVLEETIRWDLLIPLLEDGFSPDPKRPFDTVEEGLAVYRDVLSLAGEITGRRILPRAAAIEAEGHRFQDGSVTLGSELQAALQALSAAGLMALPTSREFGGMNLPSVVSFAVTEMVGYAEGGLMTVYGLSEGVADIIERFGTDEQKRRWLPRLVTGECTASMALTEPEAGSDLGRIETRARPGSDGWLVRGRKRFITNGCARLNLLLVRTEEGTEGTTNGLSLVLCEAGPGVQILGLESKLGIRSSPTCEMVLEDAPCEPLGPRGSGFKQMLELMNAARLSVAAQAVGIGQCAYDQAIEYARRRVQMGRPILEHPPISRMLQEMKISLEAQRTLLYRGVEAMDLARVTRRRMTAAPPEEQESLATLHRRASWLNRALVPLAKYFCAEESIRITSMALQVMGGNGYMSDYPLEKLYRDARITTIYEGTSEMQVLMAMKDIMGQKLGFLLEEIEGYCRDAEPVPDGEPDPDRGGSEEAYVYSAGDFLVEEEAAEPDEPLVPIGILDRSRELLVDATQYLMGSVGETGGDGYARFMARDLVDLAVYVVAGYELLRQGDLTDRKRRVAERWLRDGWPRAEALHRRMVSGDRTPLDQAAALLGEEEPGSPCRV